MEITFHGGDLESGNVFAVQTYAPAGIMLESHKHEHSHMSLLAKGIAEVTIDGKTSIVDATEKPQIIFVPANTMHKVVSVTDIYWFCLWADELVDKQKCYESLNLVPA